MLGKAMAVALIAALVFMFSFNLGTASALEAGSEDGNSFSLGAEAGVLSGFTLYHITFPINEFSDGSFISTGESELEFPINSALGGITASYGKKDLWSVDASFKTNLTRDTGEMMDSDWMTVDGERILIIYSESDTKMNHAYLFDAAGRYIFFRGKDIFLSPVVGFRYEDFSFDVSNLRQTDIWGGAVNIAERVGTYDVTYKIPYAGIALDLKPPDNYVVRLTGLFGWADSEDEDDHILRSKRATAEADGPFYSIKALGDFPLSERLSFSLSVGYSKIKTEGTQTQRWYATTSEAPEGTTLSGIDYRAESTQIEALAGLRYIW